MGGCYLTRRYATLLHSNSHESAALTASAFNGSGWCLCLGLPSPEKLMHERNIGNSAWHLSEGCAKTLQAAHRCSMLKKHMTQIYQRMPRDLQSCILSNPARASILQKQTAASRVSSLSSLLLGLADRFRTVRAHSCLLWELICLWIHLVIKSRWLN